ncbi:MAG: winged helix-turn-helix transcriptional regulator [Prevotellaceae bacterium]|nr:winged helix-turn-helix transcriptional regulator [Prevotellaceae bacterium]
MRNDFLKPKILNIFDENSANDRLIEELKVQPTLTVAELAKLVNKSETTIKRYLNELQAEGRLKRIGGRKTGQWQILP